MTERQILARMETLEKMIAKERDTSTLAVLNRCFQKLLDKLVEMDMKK